MTGSSAQYLHHDLALAHSCHTSETFNYPGVVPSPRPSPSVTRCATPLQNPSFVFGSNGISESFAPGTLVPSPFAPLSWQNSGSNTPVNARMASFGKPLNAAAVQFRPLYLPTVWSQRRGRSCARSPAANTAHDEGTVHPDPARLQASCLDRYGACGLVQGPGQQRRRSDEASDKRETAGLVVDNVIPVLPSIYPP
ncbi:hypothetical protein OF83DRAFT_1180200, partial [Amylostereum chailletii]